MTNENASAESGRQPHGISDFTREIREVADKLERDNAPRGDAKILARSLKELRYAFKVFGAYRHIRKISVFGSARTPSTHPDYKMSVEFGRLMAEKQWMVVTGAGGGIMEGAHVGAGKTMSMGANIRLPFEQEANPVIMGDAKLVTFRFFFTRKLVFVKEVDAIALFPGGFGTQDELYETLTLIQTGKRDPMPVILIDRPGSTYWSKWIDFVKSDLLDEGLISPEDLALFKHVQNLQEAEQEIAQFYRNYHSQRQIHEYLYLRLQHAPTAAQIAELNRDFSSMLETGGRFEVAPTHAYEEGDASHHLARIRFPFNRRDTGRLRQMIDRVNLWV